MLRNLAVKPTHNSPIGEFEATVTLPLFPQIYHYCLDELVFTQEIETVKLKSWMAGVNMSLQGLHVLPAVLSHGLAQWSVLTLSTACYATTYFYRRDVLNLPSAWSSHPLSGQGQSVAPSF